MYVIVTGKDQVDTECKLQKLLSKRVKYLRSIRMVDNESETELMWIGKENHSTSILVNNKTFQFKQHMQSLGIIIRKDLSWLMQAKFLRKYLTEGQFLKAVSTHFYVTVFYTCAGWYDNISASIVHFITDC